jgi:hypothetical protein
MARRVLFALGMCVAYSAVLFAQKVTSEFDDTLDFRKFKTFVVRDGQMNSPSPALNNELTKKRVQTAIERALTAKGLTKADGAPDLNVFFTLASRGVVEREEVPAGPRGLRTRVKRVPAIEGSLVIGFRDPATRSLVWRGIASDDKANPIDISKKLDDWVKKIVDKYPPKK